MRIFAITFTLIIILANSAFSDVIYFKDGRKAEGIITEEIDDHVIIDIGIGTMSVRKGEIDYIEEAAPGEIEHLKQEKLGYEIESGAWAPSGYDDIRIIYLRAKNDRVVLREARRKSRAIKEEIHQKEEALSELLNRLDKKGQELKGIDVKKNVEKYNEVVTEINSINADLNKENNKVKNLYKEEKELNAKSSKLANRYRDDFQLFKDTLNKKHNGFIEDELTLDEIYFVEEMDIKIHEMEGDFREDVASYTPEGDQIIVDVLINRGVLARLLVDTGASIVLISTDVAHRLGIESDDIHTEIEIIMADGSSVEAKPVILKSVKVGDAVVENVHAAILEKDVIGGVDGLLGMSFLSHFVIKVDSAGNKIILERVL